MKAHADHTHGDFQTVLHNGRNHSLVIDLPSSQDGDDLGPTALELTGMSLAGCISTIWAKVAENSNVSYRRIEIEMDLQKGGGTLTDANATVRVNSDADRARLERVLDKTMKACPVGQLVEQAGVTIDTTLIRVPAAVDAVA
jgi:uncharacterized OsmC-like protein